MRRDPTSAKSRLYWRVHAEQKFKKEFFMSHRDMRIYWEEPKGPLYGQLKLASRWAEWHRKKPTLNRRKRRILNAGSNYRSNYSTSEG